MVYRDFLSLTDDEVRQIVNDIFEPKKISCIKKSKKWNEITCKIYTEWEGDEDLDESSFTTCNELTLKDPFIYGERAINVDFSVCYEDIKKLKQFCFSKGIVPDWIKFNPYTAGAEGTREDCQMPTFGGNE